MLRDAKPDDLAAIVAIYNASIPGRMATADLEPVPVEERRPWYEEHTPDRRPLWVLEREGEVAAWASVQSFYGRAAYDATAEVSIYVAPRHQQKGVAQRMLGEVIRRAPALGLETLVAFVFGHNAPSLALFERTGFHRWGTLPRVAKLDGEERDLVILGLRLSERGARPRRPLDVALGDTLSFLVEAIGTRSRRVLEVGCGDGALAARLSGLGHDITAIDVSAEAVETARGRGVPAVQADFLTYESGRYDVVLFTRSLHHLNPLPAAVERAWQLLEPGGLLVADDFAFDQADRATAAFFYDAEALLRAGGLLLNEHSHPHHHHPHEPQHHQHHHHPPPARTEPLERWREEHDRRGPMHSSQAMRDAVAARFEVIATAMTPYLFRSFVPLLHDGEDGHRLVAALREQEQLRIAQGLVKPLGLRLIARRK
jgi:L-amino acid N-acyltransferase YncA